MWIISWIKEWLTGKPQGISVREIYESCGDDCPIKRPGPILCKSRSRLESDKRVAL